MTKGELLRWLLDSGLPEEVEVVVVVSGNPIEYEPTLDWNWEQGAKVRLFIARHRGGPKGKGKKT